ncbi:MAG: ferrochelatase [Prolixibacteraceae bacterium]|nr:ferrochelatase [Prolixibacteraceae bacterium]
MNAKKTAVLLMNVGSPDRPEKTAVRKYLSEFLNDRRVIDLPWLLQKFLVNLIIIPFRVKKSTGLYQKLWTPMGSPLIYFTEELKNKLQDILGDDFKIFTGMRYGNPGYKTALSKIKEKNFHRLIVFPLFPQQAMSTTETAIAAVEKEIKRLNLKTEVIQVEQFYNHPVFINAFVNRIHDYLPETFDHIVFSYHGLPNRQVEKCHPGIRVEKCFCTTEMPDFGRFCYRAACYATTRLITEKLNPDKKNYTTSFQSRLTKNWLSPFTDEIILNKLQEGKKKILVVAPSFVTDCLETIVEIEEDYRKMFIEKGGEDLQLVKSLNAENEWVLALKEILLTSLQKQ